MMELRCDPADADKVDRKRTNRWQGVKFCEESSDKRMVVSGEEVDEESSNTTSMSILSLSDAVGVQVEVYVFVFT